MYLTRLTLDSEGAAARRDLSSAYEMHRTLVRAFVEDERSRPARFLWRLEAGKERWAHPVVLVQSANPGRWSSLQRLPGYLEAAESKHVPLDRLVQASGRYRFRLLANATVCRQGKRYAITREPDLLAWVERQGLRHGFSILSAEVTRKERCRDRKIVVDRVAFEGVLQVRAVEDLRNALVAGIGPGKALGCGMLSLAPCREPSS